MIWYIVYIIFGIMYFAFLAWKNEHFKKSIKEESSLEFLLYLQIWPIFIYLEWKNSKK